MRQLFAKQRLGGGHVDKSLDIRAKSYKRRCQRLSMKLSRCRPNGKMGNVPMYQERVHQINHTLGVGLDNSLTFWRRKMRDSGL